MRKTGMITGLILCGATGIACAQMSDADYQANMARTQATIAEVQKTMALAKQPAPPGSPCPNMATYMTPDSRCHQPGYNPNANMTDTLRAFDQESPEIAKRMEQAYGYSNVTFGPFLHWAANSKLINNPVTRFIGDKTGLSIFFPIYAIGRSVKTTP